MPKIVVCGPPKSGKTELCHVYCDGVFSQERGYLRKQGKCVFIKGDYRNNLRIWDSDLNINSKEFFLYFTTHFNNCSCIMLTVDLTDPEGVNKSRAYWKCLSSYSVAEYYPISKLPVVLIGTKGDAISRETGKEKEKGEEKNNSDLEFEKFAKEIQAKCFVTSAKNNTNVEAAFEESTKLASKFKSSLPAMGIPQQPSTKERIDNKWLQTVSEKNNVGPSLSGSRLFSQEESSKSKFDMGSFMRPIRIFSLFIFVGAWLYELLSKDVCNSTSTVTENCAPGNHGMMY